VYHFSIVIHEMRRSYKNNFE